MYTVNQYYQQRYGEKVYKISIDAGFTCPNRDGTIHSDGCIFCSPRGSGDFSITLSELAATKESFIQKTGIRKYIVYFQAYTNTYAPVEVLESLYKSALIDDSIVGISIATRPDCLSDDIIIMLEQLNQLTDVYIELGLQSIHEASTLFIRSGFTLETYNQAVFRLHKAKLPVITHIIVGLPHETPEDILQTISHVVHQQVHGIKLQLLHILKDTDLYSYYLQQPFPIFTLDEYAAFIARCLRTIPESIVIYRMTGDGPKELLVEPTWSKDKKKVLNAIHRHFKENT